MPTSQPRVSTSEAFGHLRTVGRRWHQGSGLWPSSFEAPRGGVRVGEGRTREKQWTRTRAGPAEATGAQRGRATTDLGLEAGLPPALPSGPDRKSPPLGVALPGPLGPGTLCPPPSLQPVAPDGRCPSAQQSGAQTEPSGEHGRTCGQGDPSPRLLGPSLV